MPIAPIKLSNDPRFEQFLYKLREEAKSNDEFLSEDEAHSYKGGDARDLRTHTAGAEINADYYRTAQEYADAVYTEANREVPIQCVTGEALGGFSGPIITPLNINEIENRYISGDMGVLAEYEVVANRSGGNHHTFARLTSKPYGESGRYYPANLFRTSTGLLIGQTPKPMGQTAPGYFELFLIII